MIAQFQVQYQLSDSATGTQEQRELPVQLSLPVSAYLNPRLWSEDEIQDYIADNAKEHLIFQAVEICKFSIAPGSVLANTFGNVGGFKLDTSFPDLAAKMAALSGFHGLKPAGGVMGDDSVPRKYIFVSQLNQYFVGSKGANSEQCKILQ